MSAIVLSIEALIDAGMPETVLMVVVEGNNDDGDAEEGKLRRLLKRGHT